LFFNIAFFLICFFIPQADAAQAVVKTDGLQVGDCTINVAISNPPDRKQQLQQSGDASQFEP
jgi:hypothetical protein